MKSEDRFGILVPDILTNAPIRFCVRPLLGGVLEGDGHQHRLEAFLWSKVKSEGRFGILMPELLLQSVFHFLLRPLLHGGQEGEVGHQCRLGAFLAS